MWELIRSNKRKSVILFLLMGSLLILLGYVIGETYAPGQGGLSGLLIAVAIWVVWSMVAYFNGDAILLRLSHAREVTHDVHPQLYNVVEEMRIAANLPAMPKIYIIDEEAPNAFATGTKPQKSAVAVTAGLLSRLNRSELQGVIAHEMSHILNRDVLFVTFAGVMLGTIVMISEIFLRSLWYGGAAGGRYRSRRSSSKGGGGALIIIAIVIAILVPILTRLFYFAISRKREYMADASAARLTRYPEGLASALEKISSSAARFSRTNSITAPMYIVSPLKKSGRALTGLFSTHPPAAQRIKILRNMVHGVNYVNYQAAFKKVTGQGIMPGSALKDRQTIGIKKPAAGPQAPASSKQQKRELGDLMRAVNGFVFLTCLCGLKMKLPPGFKSPKVECPRCKRTLEVPLAKLAAISAAVAAGTDKKDMFRPETAARSAAKKDEGPLEYVRTGSGWETVNCACGNHLTLSPYFMGSHLNCPKCSRRIHIKSA